MDEEEATDAAILMFICLFVCGLIAVLCWSTSG